MLNLAYYDDDLRQFSAGQFVSVEPDPLCRYEVATDSSGRQLHLGMWVSYPTLDEAQRSAIQMNADYARKLQQVRLCS